MAQDFPTFNEASGGDDVRTALLNERTRTDSLKSSFSGTSFPTPVLGQVCFRTDLSDFYICIQVTPSVVWEKILSGGVSITEGGTGAADAATARTNLGLGNSAVQNIASQSQAQAGTASNVSMTPQRTQQAINVLGQKIRVTAADTTPKSLSEKITAGTGITVSVLNAGSDESLQISSGAAETGDIVYSIRASKSGYLLCDGKTIGSSASGATSRANSDVFDLYEILWNQTTNNELTIQTSSGVVTTRGASATADFSGNKRLPLPDIRGRVLAGRDDMGGSAASRLTTSKSGIDGTKMLFSGGLEDHTLNISQIPPHSFTYNQTDSSAPGGLRGGTEHGFTLPVQTNTLGGGQAHNNTQPTIVTNVFIKI